MDIIFLAVTVLLFWLSVALHAPLRPDLRRTTMGWEDVLGLARERWACSGTCSGPCSGRKRSDAMTTHQLRRDPRLPRDHRRHHAAPGRLHEARVLGRADLPRPGPAAGRAGHLPRLRRGRREGPGLGRVDGDDAHRQRRLARDPLRDAAAPEVPAVQPERLRGRLAGLVLEHGRLVHDEHELAGLLRRVDDVALHPDGGPRPPQLPLGGDRHRDRGRRHPRRRPREGEGHRQLLVRLHAGDPLGAAADLLRRRALPGLARRRPELPAPTSPSRPSRASSRRSPQGPVASQEAIKELGTNGGGFFNANSAHPYENPTPGTNFFEMRPDLRDRRRPDQHARAA